MTESVNADEALVSQTNGLPPGVTDTDVPDSQKASSGDAGVPAAPKDTQTQPEPKPVEPPKAEETPAKTDEPPKVESDATKDEYVSYGHPAADAAVDVLKEAGIQPQQAAAWFKEAVDKRDLSLINRDELVKALGQSKAELVMAGVRDYLTAGFEKATQVQKAVYEAVGSEAAFNTLRDWVLKAEQTNPKLKSEMDELRKMFDMGSTSATLAAKRLKELYESDSKNGSLVVNLTEGDGAAPQTPKLTRAEYIKQVKIAYDKRDYAEVNRLNSARQQSIGKK